MIDPAAPWQIQPIADWTFGVSGPDLAWMQSKLTPHPLKPLITPLTLTNPAAAIPRTYISCSEGATAVAITAEETRFTNLGWQYRHLPTGHDAMISMPEELTKILLELV